MTVTEPRVETVATAPARRPGTGWYGVAAMVVVIAGVVAATWFVASVASLTRHAEAFPRTTTPGTLSFTVDEPGTRYVYVEAEEIPALASLGAALYGPDGAAVPLRPYELDVRYDAYDRSGRAVASFRAPAAGTYRLVVPNAVGYVAVGDGVTGRLIRSLTRPLMIGFAGLLLGGAIAVWVAVRRGPNVPSGRVG